MSKLTDWYLPYEASDSSGIVLIWYHTPSPPTRPFGAVSCWLTVSTRVSPTRRKREHKSILRRGETSTLQWRLEAFVTEELLLSSQLMRDADFPACATGRCFRRNAWASLTSVRMHLVPQSKHPGEEKNGEDNIAGGQKGKKHEA
ncbi:hypothetical protein C8J56DRAFT_1032949 [Mycena floridula]|nr:hypothetical protein C8J56DRAFT_1032949 [Mycena floridula]